VAIYTTTKKLKFLTLKPQKPFKRQKADSENYTAGPLIDKKRKTFFINEAITSTLL